MDALDVDKTYFPEIQHLGFGFVVTKGTRGDEDKLICFLNPTNGG